MGIGEHAQRGETGHQLEKAIRPRDAAAFTDAPLSSKKRFGRYLP
jgi:hypothetical protein